LRTTPQVLGDVDIDAEHPSVESVISTKVGKPDQDSFS